jgi:CheY-like chemotaxis protein
MPDALPTPQPPESINLDFTGVFNLKELRREPPPPPPAKPRPIPNEMLVGARSLAKDNFFVNMTRPRPARTIDAAKTTILLVEDDTATRNVLGLVLQRSAGYQIRQASDVNSFVAALQQRPLPDAVILDLELPGNISGFKILTKIRAHPTIRTLPVIIFSGHADPEDLQMAIALGADAYLSKPAKVEAILAAVKGVLGG